MLRILWRTTLDKIVIVGAGQAGFAAAARLRAKGHSGSITLIGEESDAPYQRPPLSKKYLTGEIQRDRLYLRPLPYYDEQNIDFRPNQRVVAVDRSARTVKVHGEILAFDNLILATGAQPRRLPARIGGDLPGVYTIRTLADIDRLQPEVRKGACLLIVGGGYIGLEMAAVATQLGLRVTLLEASPRILQRVAAPETANFFRDLHQAHGVTVLEGVELDNLTGSDRVTGARLSDGREIKADFVVVGIGVLPRIDLAEACGLEIANGISVDEHGRTSDPNIFAVGDCASFLRNGVRIRLESVPHAIDQANVAADAILGLDSAYVAKPWFWSDQFNVKLQIAGLNSGHDQTIRRPGAKPNSVSIWYFRNSELIAVDAANDPVSYLAGKRWIEAGVSPRIDDIADADRPLKQLIVT